MTLIRKKFGRKCAKKKKKKMKIGILFKLEKRPFIKWIIQESKSRFLSELLNLISIGSLRKFIISLKSTVREGEQIVRSGVN